MSVTRHFSRGLMLANATSRWGTVSTEVALPLAALTQGKGPQAIAAIFAAQFLPVLVSAKVLARLAERVGARRFLVGSDIVRAVTLLLGALLISNTLAIIGVIMTVATLTSPVAGTTQALLGRHVIESELRKMISTLQAADRAALLAGPILAASAVTLVGPRPLLAFDAITYLVSALVLARTVPDEPKVLDIPNSTSAPVLVLLRSNRALLSLSVAGPMAEASLQLLVLAVPFMTRHHHNANVLAGFGFAAFGAGSLIGIWLARLLCQRISGASQVGLGRWLQPMTLLIAVLFPDNLAVYFGCVLVVTALNSLAMPAARALRLMLLPADTRGQVISVLNSISLATAGLLLLLGGVIVAGAGVLGLVCVATGCSAIAAAATSRAIRSADALEVMRV